MLNLGSPTRNPIVITPGLPGTIFAERYYVAYDNRTSPISGRSIEVICGSSSTEICQQSK